MFLRTSYLGCRHLRLGCYCTSRTGVLRRNGSATYCRFLHDGSIWVALHISTTYLCCGKGILDDYFNENLVFFNSNSHYFFNSIFPDAFRYSSLSFVSISHNAFSFIVHGGSDHSDEGGGSNSHGVFNGIYHVDIYIYHVDTVYISLLRI